MAPPPSTPDDDAAFLTCCINKTRSLQDIQESLGLYSPTHHSRKEPEFYINEANDLYKDIKRIAKDFTSSYRSDLDRLQAELAQDTVFSDELVVLGRDYGQTIWGHPEGDRGHSSRRQGLPFEDLPWGDAKDRILFYLRCWIIRLAVNDASVTPRKVKGKGTVRPPDTAEDDQDSDSSGVSHISYRAPEPPCMLPPPVSREMITQTSNTSYQTVMASKLSNNDGRLVKSVESAPNTPFRRLNISTPSKRKAMNVSEHTSPGKLRKTCKGILAGQSPVREQRGDIYSIPRSPTMSLEPAHSTDVFGLQRLREGTHDTDTTWMPRSGTAETEATAVGTFEVPETEIESLLQAEMFNQERLDFVDQDREQPTAGPSGTYRNPLRQDSVIPNDTQHDTRRAASEPTESCIPHAHQFMSRSFKEVPSRSRPLATTNNDGWQEKELRRELFKLLLSYLNSINQFGIDTYDTDAEERMNMLFHQLQINDTEILQARLGDDYARLHVALESWMSMRHRISEFRIATGYFGQPGRQWEEHLQRMPNVPCAHATLAFINLQETTTKAGESVYISETFDADLQRMFDLLTMVKGCNGADAFKGVRIYNAALLEWFKQDY